MTLKCIVLFLTIVSLQIAPTFSQSLDMIRGTLRNNKGGIIAGATIDLGGHATTMSREDGSFYISPVKPGKHVLRVRAMGYLPYEQEILKNEKQVLDLHIIMDDETKHVSEVTVIGKTETQQAREQAIRAVVVDTRAVAQQPVTLAELMNRSPGVRVRQSGGLGSALDISLNGFQARAVRHFKDGIPLNYLLGGYGIHNIPVNSLERVDVYKGVLPISLGADALGGAVNIVTRKRTGRQLQASYEIASFNTHRLSLSGHADLGKSFYTEVEAFFNHSDNNYHASVMVTDPETGNQTEQSVKLFHNAYTGYYTEAIIGVRDKSWAKDLRLGLAGFQVEREQQHPVFMTDPYGAVLGKQSSVVPTLRYKGDFFQDRLSIDQFAVANTIRLNTVDTARGVYDWFGNFKPIGNRIGESGRPSLSDIDLQQIVSRTNLSWKLSEKQTLSANYTFTRSIRKGEDPYGPRFANSDIDVLSARTRYNKQVAGLDWSGEINRLWSFSAMAKWYKYSTVGTEAWANRPIQEIEETATSNHYYGAGGSLRYRWAEGSYARFSTEYAYRIPEVDELFGDAVWMVPNFNLNPEKSLNFNLGVKSKYASLQYEINSFFRRTTGLIMVIPVLAPYAQFQNMNNVRGYGLEIDLSLPLTSNIDATGNATWQSLRYFGFSDQDEWRNGTRLQNTPYFFSNVGLSGHFEDIGKRGNQLTAYLNYNFVREFYLETIPKSAEPKGLLGLWGSAGVESGLIIPNQSLLSGGVNYKIHANKYMIGAEVKNILDSRLYDYFRVQRAGRSFHLKVTYQI